MPDSFEPISLSRGSEGSPATPLTGAEALNAGLNLFISNPRVIDLPHEGCITFRFKRGPLTVTEAKDGRPGEARVDLSLLEICDVEAHESEESESDEDPIDRYFRDADPE